MTPLKTVKQVMQTPPSSVPIQRASAKPTSLPVPIPVSKIPKTSSNTKRKRDEHEDDFKNKVIEFYEQSKKQKTETVTIIIPGENIVVDMSFRKATPYEPGL